MNGEMLGTLNGDGRTLSVPIIEFGQNIVLKCFPLKTCHITRIALFTVLERNILPKVPAFQRLVTHKLTATIAGLDGACVYYFPLSIKTKCSPSFTVFMV